MPSPITHTPRLLWNYLRQGDRGVDEAAERLHRAAHDQPGKKFDKDSALYLPQSPFPPILWRNQCERCRFWREGGPGEPGTCHIVGREDDPYGGEAIHPRGWCAFFTPPTAEPPFTWVRERLDPDGASAVRGQYDPSLRKKRDEKAGARGEEPTGVEEEREHVIAVTEGEDGR